MGKILKISLYGIVGIILLVIVGLISLPFFIDPNDFKPEIKAAVKQHTGRELSIEGDLELSIFPWLGISTGKLALSNAANFSDRAFAEIEQSQIKVKLLPLLSKQIEVSRIVLKRLTLNLAKNKKGQNNWDDLFKPKKDDGRAKATKPDTKPNQDDSKKASSPTSALALFTIGGISIEQAHLIWDDQQAGKLTEIKDLDLITDMFVFNQEIDVKLLFQVVSNKPALTENVELNTQLIINDQLNQFSLKQFKLASETKGEAIPSGSINSVLTMDTEINMSVKPELVDIQNLKLAVDDSNLTGTSKVTGFKQPAISFDLKLDNLDLDRYLPEKKQDPKQDKTKVVAAPAAAVVATASLLPVESLRALNINGVLLIEQLKVNGLKMQGLGLQVKAKNGEITTEQNVKQFYQGSYQGKASINAKQSRPVISVNEKLSNVQVEPLLADLQGQARMSGTVNADAVLRGMGNTVPALKSSLNGQVNFKFNDGVIKGVNIQKTIDNAKTILVGAPLVTDNPDDQTAFSVIQGSAKINNGVVNNDDLYAASSKLRLYGKGSANLIKNDIDFQLDAKKVKQKATETTPEELKDLPVALKVYGQLNSPSISPIISDSKKEKLIEKLDKKLKLEEKLPGAKELLKSFF